MQNCMGSHTPLLPSYSHIATGPRDPRRMESHRRTPLLRIAALLAVATALALPQSALAISGGVPDGNRHPNAGMLAVEEAGKRFIVCSGSYAGSRVGPATGGVF